MRVKKITPHKREESFAYAAPQMEQQHSPHTRPAPDLLSAIRAGRFLCDDGKYIISIGALKKIWRTDVDHIKKMKGGISQKWQTDYRSLQFK